MGLIKEYGPSYRNWVHLFNKKKRGIILQLGKDKMKGVTSSTG